MNKPHFVLFGTHIGVIRATSFDDLVEQSEPLRFGDKFNRDDIRAFCENSAVGSYKVIEDQGTVIGVIFNASGEYGSGLVGTTARQIIMDDIGGHHE